MAKPPVFTADDRMRVAFKRTEAWLISALMKWHVLLGYPGGSPHCGRCSAQTQWGWCPNCQPTEFARLP